MMIGVGVATTLSRSQGGQGFASLSMAAPGNGSLVVAIRDHRVRAARTVPGDGTIRFSIAPSNIVTFRVPGTGTLTAEV